jgi:DNA-binding NarL/FixJ family response regulator
MTVKANHGQIRTTADISIEDLRSRAALEPSRPSPSSTIEVWRSEKGRAMGCGDLYEQLSARQLQVLRLLALGLRNAEVGNRLGLAERTVKWYVAQLLRLFRVNTRCGLVRVWLEREVELRRSGAGL